VVAFYTPPHRLHTTDMRALTFATLAAAASAFMVPPATKAPSTQLAAKSR
jgi:hypothetical protein